MMEETQETQKPQGSQQTQAQWSDKLPVMRVRIARPTNQLEEITKFYRDGLHLKVIGTFEDHDGYNGIIFGMPGTDYQLEFTQHKDGGELPPLDNDNLLVFYLKDKQAIGHLTVKLGAMGYYPVAPANPYWSGKGVTIADPDGGHVILVDIDTV